MALVWTIEFLQFLGKDKTDFQIALGISTGMMLGLVPVSTLHWFLFLILVFALRMNILATIGSALCFSLLSVFISSPLESLGFWMLTSHKILIPFYARAYHAPIIPFTTFHHTDVMGGTLFGTLLFFPVLLISRKLTQIYRAPLHTYWLSTRLQRAYVHYRRFSH